VSLQTAADVKSCCAAAYSSPAAAFLLDESLHAGGAELTRRLADALQLRTGQRVLDVASGRGTTALLLAREYAVAVDGVDLSDASVREATEVAQRAGPAARVAFHLADAEHLPFDDGTFDALVCECSWCLFPDKAQAAAEFARVLRAGGRVGVADVTVGPAGVPDGLAELPAWIACLAGARTTDGYVGLLTAAGLTATRVEDHSDALAELIGRIQARLKLARALSTSGAQHQADAAERGLGLAARAAEAVSQGALGYCLIVARRDR
jgi:SAM-dependent methyltransferase